MVVGIKANIFQIIVLSSSPDAFLCVSGSFKRGLLITEKIGDELIHPCIGK
jgi:hypothetical protein